MDADQRQRPGIRPAPAASKSAAAAAIRGVSKQLRQLSRTGALRDNRELEELLSETAPIIEYMERRGEIEAAAAELEAHRPEFTKLAADENQFMALAKATFAEECFAPLRFTASDVQRAFDHVGYPATQSPDDRMIEIFRAAILHLADKEHRGRLATSLLLRLPEFVAAGRHAEAWLLQCSALETAEYQDQSNVFLFEMFSYGYDAWAADQRAKDKALLRELGVDPDNLGAMTLAELDSWVQAQGSDPAKAAALEAFFQNHPQLRAESVANIQALERNSAALLDRPDSRFLLLPPEEVHPWMALFSERASQPELFSGPPESAAEESLRQMFDELALPLMREMAASIFTRERILQLVAALKEYRSERFAAGDPATAGHAFGAINYLEREDSPGENTFLITLCWASLNSAIEAMTEDDRATE